MADSAKAPLRIEMWSDVVCPFCWVGKRHLEQALARLALAPGSVEVVHRAFQLDPSAKGVTPSREVLARKYGAHNVEPMWARVRQMGAQAGLDFQFERTLSVSTVDAHRLIQHAQAQGLGDAVAERLMGAHFSEGADLSDHATLRRLGVEAGLDGPGIDGLLASDRYADRVVADQVEAQALGASGVPFFVLDRRLGLAGAQPVQVFVQALQQALATPRAG